MARAVKHYSVVTGKSFLYGILDTHSAAVEKTLCKYYGGEVIARNTVPTDQILSTPHSWHYNSPEIGGNIAVIGFEFSKQLELAELSDQSLGEKSN